MRVRELDLVRYGRFADRRLDFGPGGRDSDVTVVYGENEAGKSTAFAAWLDLLFGLPPRNHPYAFRFERKDLLVRALIETPDGPLDLSRTGKSRGSLTDQTGREVDERRLQMLLNGLDREGYATRFSLDDAVLRRGGAEIAQSKGDLGQLLHAGTSGLSGMAERIADAEAEVAEFHRPGASTTVLAQAKRRLAEIDASLAQVRVDPRAFDALRDTLATADAARDAAGKARDAARRALALREAADARQALALTVAQARATLTDWPDGPDLPPDARERLSLSLQAQEAARGAAARAAQTVADADSRLATLEQDTDGLRIAPLLEEIEAATFEDGERLITRAVGADTDLGRRRSELATLRAEADRLAHRIAEGRAPAELVLPRPVLAAVRDAAEAVRAAREAVAGLTAQLADSRAELGPVETLPDGTEAFLDALAALPDAPDDLAVRHREAQQAARAAAVGVPEMWRALADAGLPTRADLREAERALTKAQDAAAAARQASDAAAEALAARDMDLAVETQRGAVTDADIADTRATRDRLWDAHRAALDASSAEAFASAMQADDAARAAHAAGVEARARRDRLEADRHRAAAEADRRAADLAQADAAIAAPRAAVEALAQRLGLAPGTPVAAYPDRLDALTAARAATDTAESLSEALRDALDRRARAIAAIETARLPVGGPTPPREDPVAAARRLGQQLEAARARIASRREADRMIATLERGLAAREMALETARETFAARIGGLWCEGLDAEAVLAVADDLAELGARQARIDDVARRVAQLEDARASFDARATDLRDRLGMGVETPVDRLLTAARERHSEAQEIARRIEAADTARKDALTEKTRQDDLDRRHASEIAALFTGQEDGPGDDPLGQLDRLLARDRRRAEIARAEAERDRLAQGFDAAALAAEEADDDPVRVDALRAALAEAEAARDTALEACGQAQQALAAARANGGSAELLQERAALIDDLRARAVAAARTRLGLMAARGALRRLREDRRGPMLKAAQAAFATMTGGDWTRLETQPAGGGERLVGLRDDDAVGADAMSTGTRGQLYLALRVAGHADFIDRFGPLPFVTDDILETFDDTRAAATLSLTAEMGRKGQAILFTHHRHLVDMARDRIPDVQVIELS